ncbi:MAG: efflux RND transporter permease subunit [Planctomycetia bacterium]|nr:efflux RND transporter permease subunit [Planctomycetia bacterium]
MSWIISTALRLRVLVIALAILLVVTGIRTADDVPLDVFPEFAPPIVEIQTEAPGISTPDVESLVTVPIENALHGIPFVQRIRSKSVLGLSSVQLIFKEGTDVLVARQLVQERLAVAAQRLPRAARPPVIVPPVSSLSRVLKMGLSSKTLSQMDMTVLCKWTIRPRLMAVPGVANVAIWGEHDRQFQVLVDPDHLRAHNLTLDAVVRGAGDATVVASGGFIDTPNQRLAVRHEPAVTKPEDLARAVVAYRGNAPLELGDVAEVGIGSPPPIGDAIINDGPGIMLIVEKQPWANTLDVTREVEAAMQALAPALKDVAVDTTIFRPATFIERALQNLGNSLLLGCILVVAVLVLFLFDWRAALISALAIPLSLFAATVVLYYRGGTMNTMVLAGLIIALGEVVDDAIIDVENILRRLRLNRQLPEPRAAFAVVLDASLEVRSAVVYASIIVVLALLPVFFLEGLPGTFFRPLAASYVLAILASLVVALVVTPALALFLLPAAARQTREAPLSAVLKKGYRWLLERIVGRPVLVSGAALGLLAAGGLSIPLLGEELLPKFKEYDFLMHFVEKPGSGVDAMDRVTIKISRELRSVEGVRNFGAHIGRAEVADEIVGPNFTELWISVRDDVPYDETVARIQQIVDSYPGLYRDVQTYLTERIDEVLTGAQAPIVVRIYGPNLAVLEQKGREVGAVMGNVSGVRSVKVEPQVRVPQVAVKMKPAASQFGLAHADVVRAAATLVSGTKVGEIYEEQKIFAVVVWGQPQTRRDVTSLRELMIDTPSGAQVRLGDVADVAVVPTYNTIQREEASRRLDVTCQVAGRDLGSVAREIEDRVRQDVAFEREYHPEFIGQYAQAQESQRRILSVLGLSLLGILLILYVDFQSPRMVLLIFLAVPFAIAGSVAGVLVGGGVVSLGSLIGLVTVLGVAVRNSIMLVDHYRHLHEAEGVPFSREAVLTGACDRLAPILMTALTTALALLPLVIGGERPGQEIEYPMALVILGGLAMSTAFSLIVVPVLYGAMGRKAVT